MSPERKMQECLSKSSFSKSLSPGQNWKSKSKRIIPEEFLRGTCESFEHRVVFSVPWNNSWQLWLHPDKKGLFMIKEDWDDENLQEDGKEIISAPLGVEPKKETTSASTSASGRTTTRGRKSCANVQNPERYLLTPKPLLCEDCDEIKPFAACGHSGD
ncbi:B3 domain-containing protein [Raphanus sativus]|nr:B3 domain-containing protein [Raphanus sativus]